MSHMFVNFFVNLLLRSTTVQMVTLSLIRLYKHVRFFHFFSLAADISFYRNYLHFIDRLHQPSKHGQKPIAFRLFILAFNLKALHFLFFYLCPQGLLVQLLLYDVVNLVVNSEVNICGWALFTSMAYIAFYFAFFPPIKSNRLLAEIVLFQSKDKSNFFMGSPEKRKQLCTAIRRKFTLTFNFLNAFRTFFFFFSTISQYGFVRRLYNLTSNWPLITGQLPCHLLLTVSYILSFYIVLAYASILSLVASFGYIQLAVLIEKLKEMTDYLRVTPFPVYRRTFRQSVQRSIVEVLQLLAEYNHLNGRLFLAYQLTNLPCSVYFFSLLVYSSHEMTFIGSLYLYVYVAVQFFSFFILHWYLIRFSRQLQVLSLLVVSFNGRKSKEVTMRKRNRKNELRIAHFIAAFHTCKMYGVTYDRVSLVTVSTFVKFFLLYSKCLLIAFKITINNKQLF